MSGTSGSINISKPTNVMQKNEVRLRPIGGLSTADVVDGFIETFIDGATGVRTVKVYDRTGVTDVTASYEVAPEIFTKTYKIEVPVSTAITVLTELQSDIPNAELASVTVLATAGSTDEAAPSVTVQTASGQVTGLMAGQSESYSDLRGDQSLFVVSTTADGKADILATYRTF